MTFEQAQQFEIDLQAQRQRQALSQAQGDIFMGISQQAQQCQRGGGLLGGLAAGGLSHFSGLVSQQFAQRGFEGNLETQLLQASRVAAREKSVEPEDAFLPPRGPVDRRYKKVRDYSEHLTRKDEKILPIEKR